MKIGNPELKKVINRSNEKDIELTLHQAGLVAAGVLTLEEIKENPKLGVSKKSSRETYKGY